MVNKEIEAEKHKQKASISYLPQYSRYPMLLIFWKDLSFYLVSCSFAFNIGKYSSVGGKLSSFSLHEKVLIFPSFFFKNFVLW